LDIFVADYGNARIQKFQTNSPSNGINVLTLTGQVPSALFLDNSGQYLYFAASLGSNTSVERLSLSNSSKTVVAGGQGSTGFGLNQFGSLIYGIYVDAAGNVYASDYSSHRVMKWPVSSTTGIVVAGVTNSPGSSATQLIYPTGVFVDSNMNLFVCDFYNGRVQQFTEGNLNGITVAKMGLTGPWATAFDGCGNMYVSDYAANRVMKYPPGSNASTSGILIAGTGTLGNGANQLNTPGGMKFDKNYNLIIADIYNNRVQQFTTNNCTVGT